MPCRAYAYTAMENRCIADDAADGCFPLQNTMQKGILTLRRGVIRCVGGFSTCAGALELQLLCTAVILFSGFIVSYTCAYINAII